MATGEVTQLTPGEYRDWYPMWSPKKDKIAFISDRSGNWDLWVMNSDGSQPAQLTFNGGLDKEPYWSPDGRSIVYVSERAGRWDVWLLDVEKTIAREPVAHANERS
jgi:TolB protein